LSRGEKKGEKLSFSLFFPLLSKSIEILKDQIISNLNKNRKPEKRRKGENSKKILFPYPIL
jgi:hypothetical protein